MNIRFFRGRCKRAAPFCFHAGQVSAHYGRGERPFVLVSEKFKVLCPKIHGFLIDFPYHFFRDTSKRITI